MKDDNERVSRADGYGTGQVGVGCSATRVTTTRYKTVARVCYGCVKVRADIGLAGSGRAGIDQAHSDLPQLVPVCPGLLRLIPARPGLSRLAGLSRDAGIYTS